MDDKTKAKVQLVIGLGACVGSLVMSYVAGYYATNGLYQLGKITAEEEIED